jgi:hypothetical protein
VVSNLTHSYGFVRAFDRLDGAEVLDAVTQFPGDPA